MKKIYIRRFIAFGLLIIVAALFVVYAQDHRALLTDLRRVPLHTIIEVYALYLFWFLALFLLLLVSLLLCRKRLTAIENVLLNAYSTLTNFFVPGQGGIAVRGIYLRQKTGLKIHRYIIATMLYYTVYALISALLLLGLSSVWWLTLLACVAVLLGCCLIIYLYMNRSHTSLHDLRVDVKTMGLLVSATLLQVGIQIAIFYVELQQVMSHVTLRQVAIYTGAANFSLFVSLTPGAIGIRESFLLFSERLHHIGSTTIVAANVIDRGIFLLFLATIFIVTLLLHARKRLDMHFSGKDPSTKAGITAESQESAGSLVR